MVNNIVCDPEKKSEEMGFSSFVQLLKLNSKLLSHKNSIRVRNFLLDCQIGSVSGGAARS